MAKGNTNPIQGRMAKKKRQRTGDLPALQRKLWLALLHAEDVLGRSPSGGSRYLACNSASGARGIFVRPTTESSVWT